MKSINLKLAVATILMGATAFTFGVAANAKGPGGGGPPMDEAGGNNLSLPAIMIGAFPNFSCDEAGVWAALVGPTTDPLTGYEVEPTGHFFVQGEHTWKAPCMIPTEGSIVHVDGAWGDNLGGDALLKTGSPIRVEIVMYDAGDLAAGQQGYYVIKLEPSLLDRESAYGHAATGSSGAWLTDPKTVGDALPDATTFNAVVYDASAWLTITEVATGHKVVDEAAGAEINATGKIVYGYNLRVVEAGKYLITYEMPNVVFDSCDIGTCEVGTATLEIEVISGGGSGGGGGGQGQKPKKPHPIHPTHSNK